MRPGQILTVLIIGIFVILFEFSSHVHSGLWGGTDILKFFLIFILIVLSIVYLISGIKHYKRSKTLVEFIPFLTCVLILSIPSIHIGYRKVMDNSTDIMRAMVSKKFEGRESIELYFKKNGYLKINAVTKFGEDAYWGSYEKQGDTLLLDIKTNFTLGKKAVIEGNNLHFIGDSTKYWLYINAENTSFYR
jgi:hypothetical protein